MTTTSAGVSRKPKRESVERGVEDDRLDIFRRVRILCQNSPAPRDARRWSPWLDRDSWCRVILLNGEICAQKLPCGNHSAEKQDQKSALADTLDRATGSKAEAIFGLNSAEFLLNNEIWYACAFPDRLLLLNGTSGIECSLR